jgi:hypothetical protein
MKDAFVIPIPRRINEILVANNMPLLAAYKDKFVSRNHLKLNKIILAQGGPLLKKGFMGENK